MSSKTNLKDFTIHKLIGKGSYAKVYRAIRNSDKQVYALKIIKIQEMKQSAAENTLNEIRLLSSIDSPFVVSYKEAFIDNNNHDVVIVMEFVGGGDLSTKILEATRSRTYFPEDTIWRYLCQALFGLQTLHSMKIVHRDIKSANLFLTEDAKTLKLGDLNIAKVLKEDLTSTQIGSPSYLAPEVWKHEKYSYNCDVFSLGCVIYEMAALKLPFEAVSMNDLYQKITAQKVGRLPFRYSDELSSVICIMLTKSPALRPSVTELLNNVNVRSRAREFRAQEFNSSLENRSKLLETIQLPKNFSQLSVVLPKYRKVRAQSARSKRDIEELSESELTRKILAQRKQIEEIELINRANINFVPDFVRKRAPEVDTNYGSANRLTPIVDISLKRPTPKPFDSMVSVDSRLEAGKAKQLPPPKRLPPPKAADPRAALLKPAAQYHSSNPRVDHGLSFDSNRASIEQRRLLEKQKIENRSGIKVNRSSSLGGKAKPPPSMNNSMRDKSSSSGFRQDGRTQRRSNSVQSVKVVEARVVSKPAQLPPQPLRNSSISRRDKAEKPMTENARIVQRSSRVSSQEPKKRVGGYFFGR